jgi:hypothetical protein
VIESADYELTISPPEWRMTPADEEARATQVAAGMQGFMNQLDTAIEQHQRGQKDPEEDWDEHDYEKLLKECDARTDKYAELLDKYGDSDEAKAKIAKEMGWDRERDEDEDSERMLIEETNAICELSPDESSPEPDPKREGIDWIRDQYGDICHPLQHRCSESALKFWRQTDELGLEKFEDTDLEQFLSEFQITGAKLAGALNGTAEGAAFSDPSFTVALLKRALDHLHKSQAGLEAVAPRKLFPDSMIAEARKELFEVREGILRLMDQYRGRG